MTSDLEQQLRARLASRAGELPPDAAERVLARRYTPRFPLRRPALVGAAALLAALVVTVALVGLGPAAPRAFAGWSPTPTSPTGDQAQVAEHACLSLLAKGEAKRAAREANSGAGVSERLPAPSGDAWRTVLIDARGPYTEVLFATADDRAQRSCFTGRHGTANSIGGSLNVQPPQPVASGQISIEGAGGNTTPPDEGSEAFSRIVGRLASDVTGVTLRLADGTRVTASTGNGWFLAWWPGSTQATAAEITTTTGTKVQRLAGAPPAVGSPSD